jgi:hypothetical protein
MTAAAQSLRDIAREHGGEFRNGAAYIPTPGHSKHDRGTVIRERRDGSGGLYVHCFQDPAAGLDVKRELGLDDQEPRKPLTKAERKAYAQQKAKEEAEREAAQLAKAAGIWNHGRPLRLSDPAGVYLTQARCIPADVVREAIEAGALRYAEMWGKPALIVLARSMATGEPRAVQITRVKRDGSGKADITNARLSFGPIKGCAARLSREFGAVAEGLETALSFRALHGVPCWALLGTSQLGAFIPPAGAKRVIIAADGDAPDSMAAGIVCDTFDRLRKTHRVLLATAERIEDAEGRVIAKDWSDTLQAVAREVVS